jgi:flavin-dependent dehydrogenase
MAEQRQTFVIVGASLAGAKAAQTLCEEGFASRIVLIGEESERPYERPRCRRGTCWAGGGQGRALSPRRGLVPGQLR